MRFLMLFLQCLYIIALKYFDFRLLLLLLLRLLLLLLLLLRLLLLLLLLLLLYSDFVFTNWLSSDYWALPFQLRGRNLLNRLRKKLLRHNCGHDRSILVTLKLISRGKANILELCDLELLASGLLINVAFFSRGWGRALSRARDRAHRARHRAHRALSRTLKRVRVKWSFLLFFIALDSWFLQRKWVRLVNSSATLSFLWNLRLWKLRLLIPIFFYLIIII